MTETKGKYKIEGKPPTIFRVVKSKDNPYVMIDRRPIENSKLSFKAKGILTYLLSRPDGWEVSVADLIKRGTDGEAAIRAGLKELKNAGHMKYTTSRESGRITGWLIEVYEVPDGDFQQVVIQDVEKQQVENRTQVLSTLIKDKAKNKVEIKERENQSLDFTSMTPIEALEVPTLQLFKQATDWFPSSPTWQYVHETIEIHNLTIERIKTANEAWCAQDFKRGNVRGILEWAVNGVPERYKLRKPFTAVQKSQTQSEPAAFEAIRQFEAMQNGK